MVRQAFGATSLNTPMAQFRLPAPPEPYQRPRYIATDGTCARPMCTPQPQNELAACHR